MGQFTNDPTAIIFKDADGEEKTFLLDATISITTSLKAQVTSYPVEDKNFISDHVQPEPLSLRISGLISQSPNKAFLSLANALAGFTLSQVSSLQGLSSTFATAAVAAGIAGAASQGGQSLSKEANLAKLLTERKLVDNDFPKRAMLGLVKLFDQATPFRVRTFFSDVIYNNMVATSLTFPQDAKTGDSLRFSMQCVKVNTARTISTVANKGELQASDPAGSSAAPAKDQGTLDGKTPNINEAEESFLSSISGG
jgi:hypothetical protein